MNAATASLREAESVGIPLTQLNLKKGRPEMNFSMNKMIASAALMMTLGAGAAYAQQTCQFGNACSMGNDWVTGGGYTEGGGEGFANAGSTFTGGNVVERGAFGRSETGFTGTFRFAVDECGDCPANTNAVSGEGFSTQIGGAFLTTTGDNVHVGSNAFGAAGGNGWAWSGRMNGND